MQAIRFAGYNGSEVTYEAIPDDLKILAAEKRQELIANLADVCGHGGLGLVVEEPSRQAVSLPGGLCLSPYET